MDGERGRESKSAEEAGAIAPRGVLDYAPADGFDTGLFVARYLQVIALLLVGWMVTGPVLFGRFTLDLSPVVLLLFASALKRHSDFARKWMLLIGGFGLLLCVFVVVQAFWFGTEHLSLNIVWTVIHHPAKWQVVAVSGAMAVVFGVPFFVLRSGRARRQFGGGGGSVGRD